MIAQRYQSLFISFLMAFLMSGIMSLVLSVSVHSGTIQNFLGYWLTDWHLSFWVALPTTLLITPLVKKLTALLVKSEKNIGCEPMLCVQKHPS
jgi:ABC-type methionine transport system permease subunit